MRVTLDAAQLAAVRAAGGSVTADDGVVEVTIHADGRVEVSLPAARVASVVAALLASLPPPAVKSPG